MATKYLDYKGLETLVDNIKTNFVSKVDLDKIIQKKTFAEWLALKDTVPEAGMILVYTDRTKIDDVPVPDIKLADGVKTVDKLPFYSGSSSEIILADYVKIVDDTTTELSVLGAEDGEGNKTIKRDSLIKIKGDTVTAATFNGTASKVAHVLTIGDQTFDGSSAITIPIYKGE